VIISKYTWNDHSHVLFHLLRCVRVAFVMLDVVVGCHSISCRMCDHLVTGMPGGCRVMVMLPDPKPVITRTRDPAQPGQPEPDTSNGAL
jgi:hypothetical protein